MKHLLVLLGIIVTVRANAQIPVEVLAGNRQIHYINYWQKDLDSAGRINFFNLSRYAIDLKDKAFNNFAIEGQLTYKLNPWLGIAAGGAYRGQEFIPTVGLSLAYQNKKGDLFVQLYPTVELSGTKAFNFFGIGVYAPRINKNWTAFSQVIFSTMLNIDKTEAGGQSRILGLFPSHQQSSQLIRIGLGYKDKYQFGIGADLNQFNSRELNFSNLGPFVRVNF